MSHVVLIEWIDNDECRKSFFRVSDNALVRLQEMIESGHKKDALAYVKSVGQEIAPDLTIEIDAF